MRRTPRPVLDLGGPHYRVSEIADAIGVHSTTVLRWIHRQQLDAKRQGENGMFLVPYSALAAANLLAAAETNDPEPTTTPAEATQLLIVGENR